MMECALILSQPFQRYLGASFVLAADKGYERAVELGLTPNLLVGDMDSLDKVPDDIETVKVAIEKDFSDGELGIREAKKRGFKNVDIYGGLGGRPDHFLYNLNLLKIAFDLGVSAVIRGDHSDIYYTESTFSLAVKKGDTLSVYPLGDSVFVEKAEGFKYQATGKTLSKTDTLGLSNLCEEEKVSLKFTEGGAFIIHIFS